MVACCERGQHITRSGLEANEEHGLCSRIGHNETSVVTAHSSLPAQAVSALRFVDGAGVLASGGEDTFVYAWALLELLDATASDPAAAQGGRAAACAPLHAWTDHTLPVSCLAATSGGAAALLASGSLDRAVKLRRLGDGALLASVALPAAVNDLVLDASEAGKGLGGHSPTPSEPCRACDLPLAPLFSRS